MKALKIWNGRGWSNGGHIYVAAHSRADAVRLSNEAYRKANELVDRPDFNWFTDSEAQTYWSPNCWGTPMKGITPERGVWYSEKGQPVQRII